MSSLAPRQNFLAAVAFLDGMCNIILTAINTSPTSFKSDQLKLLQSLVDGFKYDPFNLNVWFTDYSFDYRNIAVSNINTVFNTLTKSTPEDTVFALVLQCYEIVNKNAKANTNAVASVPTVLVDLVIFHTTMEQTLPVKEYIQFVNDLWAYITGIGPSADPNPISSINWIPDSAYGVAVALMLKKYFNYDGRFSYNNLYWNVDRNALVTAYESGTKIVANKNERNGLTTLVYTFKVPDWTPNDAEDQNMLLAGAIDNVNVITQVDSGTTHTLNLNGTKISNFMPFRAWFDICDKNGNSFAQFKEGDNYAVSGTCYMIKMAGTPVYPSNTITLGPNDVARVTNVNVSGVSLTGIWKDGVPYPEIQFTPSPIY